MPQRKIILPGGSGFLGRTLAKHFASQGDEVVVLTRGQTGSSKTYRSVHWDAETIGDWAVELENADAVINLAGRTVNCRYTPKNRKQMMDSRVQSTLVLGEAMSKCTTPPPVWMNSSTATIYRHRYDAANTESDGLYGATPEAKDAYSLEVAHAWEDAFQQAYSDFELTSTRGLILRTAMVFGSEPGGVYETLRRLTKFGLGGKMADGKQFVSWLHARDFCYIVEHLISNNNSSGIYNLTAPHPVTNSEMMQTLRSELNIPIGLPAPRPLLEIGAFVMRTETELIVKSRRVEPERLLHEGYDFHFSRMAGAVRSLEEELS